MTRDGADRFGPVTLEKLLCVQAVFSKTSGAWLS